jgi:hypothetical protein
MNTKPAIHPYSSDRLSVLVRVALAPLVVAFLVLALAPAAARAGTIVLGAGQQPDVAIDSSGTAYVAWNSSDDTTLYFCRLPRSASSCTPVTLPVRDFASARPAVFVTGSTVRVLTNRCCSAGSQTELFTSSDGGSTFGSPVLIGNVNPSGDAVSGPGNGISSVTSALINSFYQLAPASGSPLASAQVALSSQYTYHGVIGIASGRPVVVFDNLNNLAWTTTNAGDPNQGASWQGPEQIAAGHDPHLANGPGGLFLVSTNSSGNLELREFTGSGWSGPTPVQTGEGPVSGAVDAFAEGPTGGLSIVFRTTSGNPTNLDFTGSTDGLHWSWPLPIATDSAIGDLRVAAAPSDGTGLAVWGNGSQVSAARHPAPAKPTAPTAAFSISPPGQLCAGHKVYFDASGSEPGSAPITSYTLEETGPPEAAGHVFLSSLFGQQLGLGSFSYIQYSDAPSFSDRYVYSVLFNLNKKAEFVPVAEAVLGTTVTLTVKNGDGLTDSVTHTLPFRYPIIQLTSPTNTSAPPCYGLADVTGPPAFRSSVLTLVRISTVDIRFGCTAAALCGGLVRLSTVAGPGGVTAGVARARQRSGGEVVGQIRFALTRGHHVTIRIKLNKRGQALARQGRLRRLRVTVTTVHLGRGQGNGVSRVLGVKRAGR